jgi:hypothetical protein
MKKAALAFQAKAAGSQQEKELHTAVLVPGQI